ncbi:MAG: glycosyltransferase family 2 protein [Anaerolineales bacterium]|nr:glycosyltransferase family 2 protein [Anaerolineales bacterium]
MLISFVIPSQDEEPSLRKLAEQIIAHAEPTGHELEIIFIDDGSTDNSLEVLKGLHQEDPRIKVIRFRRNFGKAAALMAGFAQAKGEIIFTMDADLQDDPAEIPRFLAKLEEGYDLVSGWKYPRLDPITKTAPSKLANFTIRLGSGMKLHDFNCGYKAMRAEVAKEIKLYGDLHRYVPVLADWRGFDVTEIKVRHHPRQFGRSKYGFSRLSRGLFDFITVIFLIRFTRRPLHFFGWLGLISLGLGFLIDGYLSILWLMGHTIGHRPLLTLGTLLIIIGAQFFSLGLLAELLSHSILSREEEYTIREILE